MFGAPKKTEKSKITYSTATYENHWAKHIPQSGDENFIATLVIFNKIYIALKLNPTDARGYRAIAVLIDNDMSSTFNREYTLEEKLALNTALAILSSVYEKSGVAVQTEIAGNNSQSVTEDGDLQLGNETEPSLLHGHFIARGNPKTCYIGDVPLRGPIAGKLFNMRGDGQDEGNQSKARWEAGEMKAVADKLAGDLKACLDKHPVRIACIAELRPASEASSAHKM